MSVRRTDEPSWKIHVCSRNKWTLLENYKKVAPGKKEQIFSKTVSVAASVFRNKDNDVRCYSTFINPVIENLEISSFSVSDTV